MSLPVTRKEIFGWCCYDFANSSYTTIIITVVYSRYFLEVVFSGQSEGYFWWGATLAISQLLVIVASPLLGRMADQHSLRKRFLMVSTAVCVLATGLLGWTGSGTILIAISLVILSNAAFSLGESFCSSFLPDLSTKENIGRISGYGWSFGYFGGLISLGLALLIVFTGEEGDPDRTRWIFPITATFFLIASLPTFAFLTERSTQDKNPPPQGTIIRQFIQSLAHLRDEHPDLLRYFICFLCYMSGVTAIIAFASIYARDVLAFTVTETIGMFIALQLSSALGAFCFGFSQDRIGAKTSLLISLGLWLVVCLSAALVQTKLQFLFVAALAGLVIGSTQAISRAVVGILMPEGTSGQTFGLWNSFAKGAAIIGPLTFGIAASFLDPRIVVLSLALFFLFGGWILLGLPLKSTRHD
ncbi:MAG: MFS transporter [Verrucomicrobiota bacterium]